MEICRAFEIFELIIQILYIVLCIGYIIWLGVNCTLYIKDKGWRKENKTEKLSMRDWIIIISFVIGTVVVVTLCIWGIQESYIYIKSMFC